MDQHYSGGGICPTHIGKYRIVRQIGEGGMGDIYLGEDQLGMQVAIKAYPAWSLATEKKRKRFLREARLLASLKHPGICQIYGIEEVGDRPFIVMEHLEGVTLAALLRYLAKKTITAGGAGSSLSEDITTIVKDASDSWIAESMGNAQGQPGEAPAPARPRVSSTRTGPLLHAHQALSIISSLCDALNYSHQHGIIHRDLKPSNIIIRPNGEPVLLDFGIAKHLDDSATLQLTATGELLGTLGYMSPEQAAGKQPQDERVDVFAAGAIAYELLTGRRLFRGRGNPLEDYQRFLDFVPTSPRHFDRRFDRELEAVLLKAVSPDLTVRYRFISRLKEDINRYIAGEPVKARKPGPVYRFAKYVRRNRVGVGFAALVAAGLLTALGYLAFDYYMQKGRWITVYEHDFLSGTYDTAAFDFSLAGANVPPWHVDSTGLHIESRSWCWFSAAQVPEDCRIELELRFEGNPDGIELCLNSKRKEKSAWPEVPAGYSCQIGGYNGTLDFISVNRREALARIFELMESSVKTRQTFTVVFERIEDRLVLRNGANTLEAVDFAPMHGEAYRHIGLHAYTGSARLRRIRISRMALPQKPSPLVVGDVLLSRGSYDDACETFLRIGRDHLPSRVGRKALVRAYYATRYLEDSHADSVRVMIRSVMERDHSGTAEWEAILYLMAEDNWNSEGAAVAIECLEKLSRSSRKPRYLHSLDPSRIPPRFAARATRLLVSSGKGMFLDVSNMLGDSLEILEGARIVGLTARSNGITDLEPLRDMPLVWVTLDDNHIGDLSPVAGPQLRLLSAHSNKIKDLSPLRMCKLSSLNLSGNLIDDISQLAGMPLTNLELRANYISDISALSAMELKSLDLEENYIPDLRPLAGMGIRRLGLIGNPIESFAPLASLPLRQLSVSGFRQQDLDYLRNARLASLEVVGGSVRDLSPLDGQPLQSLVLDSCGVTDLSWASRFHLSKMRLRNNRISDLSSIRGLDLSVLDITDNHITDLSPLEGMALSKLHCSGNPLRALGSLIENPPREFEFWCPTLAEHELRRAIDAWKGEPKLVLHRQQARTLYYLKKGQADSLKALAFTVGANRYLLVKSSSTFQQADSVARLAGGHLWTLSHPSEAAQVAEKIPGTQWVFLNAELRDGEWVWRHPSGDTALLQHGQHDSRFPFTRIRTDILTTYSVAPNAINGFVIEWEGGAGAHLP